MLNKFFGGGTIKRFVRSLLTTDKTVSTAGLWAADAVAVKELNDKFPKVLWTNPSPSSSFAAQTIDLSDDPSLGFVICYRKKADTAYFGSIYIDKDRAITGLTLEDLYASGGSIYESLRSITSYNSSTKKLTFNGGSYFKYGTGSHTSDNTFMVPTQILGIYS